MIRFLKKKLSSKAFILLDMKKGNKKELFLLITTLKELGIKYSDNLYFKYSSSLMRHLSTLGWPIGRSLYKQRKIKKDLSCFLFSHPIKLTPDLIIFFQEPYHF